MTSTDVDNLLARAMNAGQGEHLGSIVMWTCSGILTSSEELKRAACEYEVPPDWIPAGYGDASAFRLSCRLVQRTLGRDRTHDLMFYGVVNKAADDARDAAPPAAPDTRRQRSVVLRVERDRRKCVLSAQTVVTIDLLPDGSLSVSETDGYAGDGEAHGIAEKVMDGYEKFRGMVDTNAFRRALRGYIADTLHACPLRSAGGVYWVPSPHHREVTNLRRMITGGEGGFGKSKFHVLEVFDVMSTLAALQDAARSSINAQLAELQDKIASITEASRRGTVESCLAEVLETKKRTELYAEVLRMKAHEIKASLDEMLSTVTEKLAESRSNQSSPAKSAA